MFAIKLDVVFLIIYFNVSYCERRIKGGDLVKEDKRYVVYLVKAPISPRSYDAWLCGGALVNSEFVITSAACVDDVEFIYVIAGYKKYITDENIEKDECTRQKKKKVVYTCTPVSYELVYEKLDKWSDIDIALVKVESPYDFNDATYQVVCSYIPTSVLVNYESKYQEPDTDAMVLGWGHTDVWRKPTDTENYNQENLRYAPVLILDKEECKKHYDIYPNMRTVIDRYMICSYEGGNINDNGDPIATIEPKMSGCTSDQQKLLGFEGQSCEDNDEFLLLDNTRRGSANNVSMININNTRTYNRTADMNKTEPYSRTIPRNFRKNGICQNDHGGPLVTWVGTHEVLIGVASVFKVSEDSKCIGPYLYTSTQCNGAFLDCVLNSTTQDSAKSKRRALCDSPPIERGYDTVEKHISWKHHPAGPADNERDDDDDDVYPFTDKKKKNVEQKYKPKVRYEAPTNYASNERYKAPENYAAKGRYKAPEDYAANVNYAPYTSNNADREQAANYAANERYKQPENANYAANERYPYGNNPPRNANYAVNERYTQNNKPVENENYAANVRYTSDNNPADDAKYSANGRYAPDNNPAENPNYSNIRNTPNNNPIENANYAPIVPKKKDDGLVFRPQRPILGSI